MVPGAFGGGTPSCDPINNCNNNKDMDSKKYVWKKRTLWSYYFEGNVEIPEICIYSINLQCPDEKEGCSRLHAKKSWHWQLLNNNEWYNFLSIQSDRLERAFQIVGTNEVVIPSVDPSKTGKLGQELSKLLGTECWKADFNQMKITKLNYDDTIEIRRLATPSSAKFKNEYSTDFRWFFQQDKSWVEFGQCVENDKERSDESTHTKFQTTSSEIEKEFQKDQDGFMTVNVLDGKYKIIFSKMELVNETSKNVVSVRRRPKTLDVMYPTVWSYHIRGDVDKAEICMETVGETCAQKNGCGRLHSNVPWHWQILHNGVWYNLPKLQMDELEKAYVSKGSAKMPKINSSKMGLMGTVLSPILGATDWLAEFDSMTITRLNLRWTPLDIRLHIRRLSSPSSLRSPDNFATNFAWFFQNKEGIWVQFASTENTEDESTLSVQQTSSYDIEKCFVGTQDAMIVNIMNSVFELSFSSMMLHNCNTQEEMPVRRRPHCTRSDQIPSRIGNNVVLGAKALSATSKEYQEVKAHLLLSLKLPKIESIKRIKNPKLWNVFQKRQEKVSAKYSSDEMPEINILFHWVRKKAIEDICTNNFEWEHQCPEIKEMCKNENGVFFFRSAEFLHKSCSSKSHRLLMFKVLVGKIKGPKADTSGDKVCSSTVDDNIIPNRYIKYDKRDYCPAYIIKI